MLTVNVRLEGLPQTQAMLRRVKKVLNNMETGLTAAGEYLLQVFSVEVFESEGAVYGSQWPSLNPRYALRKSQQYPGRGILERTGELRRGFGLTVGSTFAELSNPVAYGRYHQLGQGVPQRVIVALEKRQRDRVRSIIRQDTLARLRTAI